jgi:hypothetical protein
MNVLELNIDLRFVEFYGTQTFGTLAEIRCCNDRTGSVAFMNQQFVFFDRQDFSLIGNCLSELLPQ